MRWSASILWWSETSWSCVMAVVVAAVLVVPVVAAVSEAVSVDFWQLVVSRIKLNKPAVQAGKVKCFGFMVEKVK